MIFQAFNFLVILIRSSNHKFIQNSQPILRVYLFLGNLRESSCLLQLKQTTIYFNVLTVKNTQNLVFNWEMVNQVNDNLIISDLKKLKLH